MKSSAKRTASSQEQVCSTSTSSGQGQGTFGSFTTNPFSRTGISPDNLTINEIISKCRSKSYQVFRQYRDLKSVGAATFLQPKDLESAHLDAIKKALEFCDILLKLYRMPLPPAEVEVLRKTLLQQLEKMWDHFITCNEQKRIAFITRCQSEIWESFVETLKLRFHWLYTPDQSEGRIPRPCYDQRITEKFVTELVATTLDKCEEYAAAAAWSDVDSGHTTTSPKKDQSSNFSENAKETRKPVPFALLRQEITAAGNCLISRNREHLEEFQRHMTSSIYMHAVRTARTAKEKIQGSPFMCKQEITARFEVEKVRCRKKIARLTSSVQENRSQAVEKYEEQMDRLMDKFQEKIIIYANEKAKQTLGASKTKLIDGIPKVIKEVGKACGIREELDALLKTKLMEVVDDWFGELEVGETLIKLTPFSQGEDTAEIIVIDEGKVIKEESQAEENSNSPEIIKVEAHEIPTPSLTQRPTATTRKRRLDLIEETTHCKKNREENDH